MVLVPLAKLKERVWDSVTTKSELSLAPVGLGTASSTKPITAASSPGSGRAFNLVGGGAATGDVRQAAAAYP
eukprot:CAMPEP_0202360814 /NCGR_PEP_ID=MMETSP1126-20121109/13618_1 /ASSEMBLY_ACC=CAM_ASM_000457 /TAXON_ID=3047 /ORGANISM="Dunaliella tertiolecta, Strain CCMP1320" /LENGTH=71 /DNA_ID=CAMNT_0048954625 /DNA_START=307 /DNA_END=519 /DNA_ORIENTATION=+